MMKGSKVILYSKRILCVVVLVWIVGCFGKARLPSDQEIGVKWNDIKSDVEALRGLLEKQPKDIVRIWPDGVMREDSFRLISYVDAGMTTEDYSEFKKRMKNSGIFSIFRSNEEIAFPFLARGFASSGYRVHFVFREISPKEGVIMSMKDFKREAEGSTTRYLPLEDGWYVKVIW